MTEPQELRVLLVEDSPEDADLIVLALKRGGFAPKSRRVETAEQMTEALARGEWQIVLSDYSMPSFDGLTALRILQKQAPSVPFILVSGAVGEETAVEVLKSGARDFVLKDRLGRLAPAVRRELQEAENLKEWREKEREVRTMMRGLARATGPEAFDNIISGLCEWLDADHGLICEWSDDHLLTALSCQLHGRHVERFTYKLGPTPCQEVISQGFLVVGSGLCSRFPDDPNVAELAAEGFAGIAIQDTKGRTIGVLCIFTGRELREPERLRELMEIMAAKAGSEIERLRADRQRAQLEIKLRQAQKMEAIGTLAGGIAHDFNNILTAVIGYTEIAKLKLAKTDPVLADLSQVLAASQRAKDLVSQILAFSRHSEHERRPLKLDLIVREALKLLRASIPTTIELQQEIPSDLGTVLADPSQMHQIVMNLCANAGHAMQDKGGCLRVALECLALSATDLPGHEVIAGDYLKLTVSDTGVGIPPELLDRIFEPYFTTKEKGVGTGLGLAVVHGIVQEHGGHIMVESAKGKGTAFHIFLPRMGEQRQEIASQSSSLIVNGGAGERILFVDDEKPICGLADQLLSFLGYRATLLTSSLVALEVFRQDPTAFDLVITDMTMPGLTGLELAGELLALRPELPIILCTGHSDLVNEEGAKAAGIRSFLMKPLETEKLASTIRVLLASSP